MTIPGAERRISSAIGSDLRELRMPWDRTSHAVWMPSSIGKTADEVCGSDACCCARAGCAQRANAAAAAKASAELRRRRAERFESLFVRRIIPHFGNRTIS